MNLLIFKTNLSSSSEVNSISNLFNNHECIQGWNVDTTDIDNVLRVEANDELAEKEIIHLLVNKGYFCDVLPD